jgi:hypothetical protein
MEKITNRSIEKEKEKEKKTMNEIELEIIQGELQL